MIVFDAGPMIAYLKKEPGWEVIRQALVDNPGKCFAHNINLCEVFYDTHRSVGEAQAQTAIQDLLKAGVLPRSDFDDVFWQEAGRIKSQFRRVSLADCFGIVLAHRLGAEFLTSDRHELAAIASDLPCPVRFIR